MTQLGLHDPARGLHERGPSVHEGDANATTTAAGRPDCVSQHQALLVVPAAATAADVHAFLASQENS